MPAPVPQQQMQGQSVWQKMKMGAMMGTGVGLTIGFIFGSYSILRQGAGPRGVMATLSQYMLTSAASFGFFLSIGSVIRNDSPNMLPPHLEAMRASLPVVVQNRPSLASSSFLRARWEVEKQRQNTSS